MRSISIICFVMLLGTLLGGCAGRPMALSGGNDSRAIREWVHEQGGTLEDARTARAQAVMARLTDSLIKQPVPVHVLANHEVTAYSWPSGEVFVTAGLVDRCTDAALMAALAHELGHLLNDGHLRATVAVGGHGHPDNEVNADLTGCDLLRAHGVSTVAMEQALTVAEETSKSPTCRAAMQRRINLLRAQRNAP